MPCMQHGLVNRISVLSAVPLILSSYGLLRSASDSDTWDELSSESCRRQNLALVATGVASALWVNFAPIITKIPGSELSHQAYSGLMKKALLGAFGSAATLSAFVWQRSLPENVRSANDPTNFKQVPLFSLPGRVADGVCKSIVSIAPGNSNNPVNVKYSLLTTGFLILTALQTLGPHPLSVIPSWTGRRLARAFPAWTLLAAVTSYDLKEATENGKVLLHENRILSRGIKGYGVVYLASKVGAVFFDPSFPVHYPAVKLVSGWAAVSNIKECCLFVCLFVYPNLCMYIIHTSVISNIQYNKRYCILHIDLHILTNLLCSFVIHTYIHTYIHTHIGCHYLYDAHIALRCSGGHTL